MSDAKLSIPGCSVLPPMEPARPSAQAKVDTNAKQKLAGRKAAGRFAELNAFIDFTMGGLTGAELAVWMVLFRDTKTDGLARTSQADIARRTVLNVRTVKRAVASLRAGGLLQVVQRGRLKTGPSTYRIHPLTATPIGTPVTP